MTDLGGGAFHAGERGLRPPGRKGPQGVKAGRKARGTRKRRNEPLIEQPIAQSDHAVRCPTCRCPVDPKRLHIHMVRFHGAALRPGQP
jgi:hypothetical protein